jgi:hypothetical protein
MTTVLNCLRRINERQLNHFALTDHTSCPIFANLLDGHSRENVIEIEKECLEEHDFVDGVPLPITNLASPMMLDQLSNDFKETFNSAPIVNMTIEFLYLIRILEHASQLPFHQIIEGAYHVVDQTQNLNFKRYFTAKYHIPREAMIIPPDLNSQLFKLDHRFVFRRRQTLQYATNVDQLSVYILMPDGDWYCHPCKLMLFPRHAQTHLSSF